MPHDGLVAMNPAVKLAALPLALAATWTTAEADDFTVTVTPTENLSHLRLFTEQNDAVFPIYNTVQGQALSADLGPLAAGSTYSTTLSTSYGTSAIISFPFIGGSQLELGALAVTSGGDLALSSTLTLATDYTTMFGASTSVTQPNALSAATTGDLVTASALYPAGSQNALYGSVDNGTTTATLYAFNSLGAARAIGTASVTPVPEPASMAALGLGALGLLRRRRRQSL